MKITINNKIKLEDPPNELRNALIQELKTPNPKFLEAQRLGYSTYGIDQYIINFSIDLHNNLLIPRGYRRRLISLLKEMNIGYTLKDERTIFPYIDIDSSEIMYRPYQTEAVVKLTSENEGMLISPAGSGKTVMGLSLIPLLGQPTLWITHTGPLASQTKAMANKFLPSLDVGTIEEGKWDLGDVLTIGMVQTLIRDPKKLYSIRDKFGLVIQDECLISGTQILMLDGSVKNISNIKDGEVTTFGKVSNKFSRVTNELINLRGGWGHIEGTKTHVLPFIPYKSLKLNLHTGNFLPPTEDQIIYDTLSKVNPKDFLLVKESICHTEKYSIGKKRSRLLALIACDGHITKNLSCIQVGITKDKSWFLNEMYNSTSFEDVPDIKEVHCKRGDLIIRCNSKPILKYLHQYIPAGKKEVLYVPSIMEHTSLNDIKEYLQVVFDTEGGLNDNQITITMSTPEFLIGIQHLLKKFGIISRIIPIKKKNTLGKSYLRLAMAGYDAFLFYIKIGFSMKRKQSELLSIVKRTNKFVRYVVYKNVRYRCMPVISKITKKGNYKVYDFTTEKHLFIANNVLSSNCHHTAASTFLEVISQLNPYYLYGLTATPYRRDRLENVMFQIMGQIIARIPIEKVIESGGIILPTVRYKTINSKRVDTNKIQTILKDYIVDNMSRNRIIVSDVLKDAVNNNFCIVVSDRREHCEILYNLISVGWEQTGIATGKYSKKYVQEQVNRFNKKEITVLVTTTQLLGEGFDVPFINRGFIAMPFRAEAKAEQVIGRLQRTHLGKDNAILYDYVDADIGVLANQFYSRTGDCRYRAYTRLGVTVEPY